MSTPVTAAPPPSWGAVPHGPPIVPPSPRPWRGLVIALAAVVTAAAIASVAWLSAASFFVRQEQVVRTFDAAVTSLRVNSDVGDLTVRTGRPGESARIVADLRYAVGKPQWSAGVDGSTLVLDSSCDGAWSLGVDVCSVDFYVVLPPGSTVDVRSAGDVRVTGASGPLTVTTGTGDIRVRETTGPVDLTSSTGDVDGVDLGAAAATARTGTGDVRLRFAASPPAASARSDTGDVLVLLPSDGTLYRVDASSGTGDVKIDVPAAADADRTVTARTGTGDVRILPDR